jgi:hypothetical protein
MRLNQIEWEDCQLRIKIMSFIIPIDRNSNNQPFQIIIADHFLVHLSAQGGPHSCLVNRQLRKNFLPGTA